MKKLRTVYQVAYSEDSASHIIHRTVMSALAEALQYVNERYREDGSKEFVHITEIRDIEVVGPNLEREERNAKRRASKLKSQRRESWRTSQGKRKVRGTDKKLTGWVSDGRRKG